MANEVGSANNLEDLFGKIVNFLTTNATLVAANQQWSVLRQRRDNILSLTSNITDATTVGYATLARICRYDPRQLNTDDEQTPHANFKADTFSLGSHITWRLRSAKDVVKVRVRAPVYTSDVQYMMRNFRLQYSDNGSSWTTAATITPIVYSVGERRDYTVTSVGAHEYWRVIIDTLQNGSTILSIGSLLLLTSDETVANHFGSEVILKARGNAATEEIFTGIRSEYDASGGWYNLFLNGYTGYNPNETSWFKQPGALPGFDQASIVRCAVPMIPCWDTTMPYWFSASGRSFRMGVKVSTNYEGGYLGFFLPYATPGQYPYPLAIGGSLVPNIGDRSSAWRYSYVSHYHGVFCGPGGSVYGSSEQPNNSTLYIRGSDGAWRWFSNRPNTTSTSESIFGPTVVASQPYAASGAIRTVWPHCVNDQWGSGKLPYRECIGGGYILQPVIPLQNTPVKAVLGELEGIYIISGYENSPENTLTYNGKTVTVFQNAYRNTVHEFWALSLD